MTKILTKREDRAIFYVCLTVAIVLLLVSDDTATFTGYHFVGTKVLDTIYTDKPYHRKVVIRKYGGHNASDHCAVVVSKE